MNSFQINYMYIRVDIIIEQIIVYTKAFVKMQELMAFQFYMDLVVLFILINKKHLKLCIELFLK